MTPRADALDTPVPWVMQDILPDYHGVAWYWRTFDGPALSEDGRALLRFWNVDYLGEVWLNGEHVGMHEGADGLFVLDATPAYQPGAQNLLAVRVLNPTDEPIDGIALRKTPHRNKTCSFTYGCDYNHGGIEGPVELLTVPPVYLSGLHVMPEPDTGIVGIEIQTVNTLPADSAAKLSITVAPAAGGEAVATGAFSATISPGTGAVQGTVKVPQARLWQLDDPFLYRVTVRLAADGGKLTHQLSTRCGFRDFRIRDGYFRLNGERVYLRGSHTGNMYPIGVHLPWDADLVRRDLINVKAMGFNAIRFIAGLPTPEQLDFCDEIGLLVYDEPYSAWMLEDSPAMAERFDRSVREMVVRDRNHPSVVIWGLLNETHDGPVFEHAIDALGLVRVLDRDRVVLLNSGRFDCRFEVGSAANPGSDEWQCLLGDDGLPDESLRTMYPSPPGAGQAHIYPQVPHRADAITLLRTYGGAGNTFLSEYGVSSAVDLVRLARNYEQRGREDSSEAKFYRRALDKFLVDWERFDLAATFGRPEDYFAQCIAKSADDRLAGINALRANPRIVGYSLTGTVDQGYSGEGLTTAFRELKPGMVDAVFDGLAPLRWCLFAEPVNVYPGAQVQLEAVLANEDVLLPGEYPVRIEVLGPGGGRVFVRETSFTVEKPGNVPEPPFVLPVFSEKVRVDWADGEYRLTATLLRGGAAAGREARFRVFDPADMPHPHCAVTLWGDDPGLAEWLRARGIACRGWSELGETGPALILAASAPPAPGGAEAFDKLMTRVERGAAVVFLSPSVFADGEKATAWVPAADTGAFIHLPGGVYHKDDWAIPDPVLHGLPTGVLDYGTYRELVNTLVWTGSDTDADIIAGAIQAAPAYGAGTSLTRHRRGDGLFYINTLRIREVLESDPVAELLLRNLLMDAIGRL